MTKALALYRLYARRTAATLAGVVAVSIFAYGAFLLLAVAHAAELGAMEERAAAVESRVSQLQARYLAETKSLTLERALAMGFVEPVREDTVAAEAAGLSLVPEALAR